jgi:hypothetical protein
MLEAVKIFQIRLDLSSEPLGTIPAELDRIDQPLLEQNSTSRGSLDQVRQLVFDCIFGLCCKRL